MATRTLAILLFDDVEVLDFCGPFEVFSVANRFSGDPPAFNVLTVADKAGPVLTRGDLSVNPQHRLPDCPQPDLLLIPGGQGTLSRRSDGLEESRVPRQNRVTPFGEIIATPERGRFLGNRGVLHDAAGRIKRAWQVKRWLVCVLEFRGRKRRVMIPGSYTELFFLDEATALAAGHRPCAECRHARFLDFCTAWRSAYPVDDGLLRPTADEIDSRLHAERVNPARSKRTFTSALDGLPDGVFVTLGASGGQAYLVWGDGLFPWSPGGYGERRPRPKGVRAVVLTPPSTVAAIRAGYIPEVHPSARR